MNATARMMTRVDRKYLLSTAEAFTLVDALPSRTRILTVNDQFWQHYRTSYLDSSRWGSYHATAYKRRRRYKVRMRNYVDSGLAFLEVKTRGLRKTTVKNRTPIPAETVDGDAVPAESVEWLAGMLEPLCVSVDVADLRPTLRNEYWRATVKLPDLGERRSIPRLRGGARVAESCLVWILCAWKRSRGHHRAWWIKSCGRVGIGRCACQSLVPGWPSYTRSCRRISGGRR